MKFATVEIGGERAVVAVDAAAEAFWPVADLVDDLPPRAGESMVAFIRAYEGLRGRLAIRGVGRPLGHARLCAPIPRPPRDLICVGKNYREHAREFTASGFDSSAKSAAEAVPDAPIVFTKAPSTVIGPGEAIPLHPGLDAQVDYEAELAVVIGRGGRGIKKADALGHVFGYTIVNDVTARDLQAKHKQWFIGKSLDGFCPMGPWIVTADELDGTATGLRCRVNGEMRQDADTRDLIFDIPTLIETISAGITLEPGDVIATGTPAGVAIGFTPPKFLKEGDIVEIEIDGIGRLANPVRRLAAARPAAVAATSKGNSMRSSINGKQLAVEVIGQGAPLVLVHGLGGTSNTWAPQVAVLKRDFKCILPDLTGCGRSETADGISIDSHVADLLAVMDAHGVAQAHLAGHSMGTIICQHLAARHPERVLSLALMGALREPPEAARTAIRDRAAKARSEGMAPIADAIVQAALSEDTRVNQPAAAAFVRESVMRQDPEGYARNCEALAAAKPADLSGVRCRVLLVTGTDDKTAPPDAMRALASAFGGAETVELPGSGHWATVERAKQVNYALTKFYAYLKEPLKATA